MRENDRNARIGGNKIHPDYIRNKCLGAIGVIALRTLGNVCTNFRELLLIFESVRFLDILFMFYKMKWSSDNGE